MDSAKKIGAGIAASVGAVIGGGAVFSAGRLLDAAFDRNSTSFSRRARTAQPCGLPPFPVEDPEVLSRMEGNALAIEERVQVWYRECDSERVSTTVGKGGINLSGRIFFAARPSRMWAILAHSYRSTGREMEKFARMYSERGFNVLNVDLRAHGESGGTMIGMGWQDGQDILEWVGYLTSRFGADISIVLHGQSMGAAAVLNASAWAQFPQVVGVVADSPFASLRDIAIRMIRRMFIPPAEPLYAVLRLAARARLGWDPSECNPVDTIVSSRVPTLIVHGSNDDIVPSVEAANLYYACGAQSKRLHIVADAGHMGAFFVDPDAYGDVVFDFFGKAGIV
ncbi:MAG: alpha/beta fold hydrolase [Coriobacteriaceae bacterium]|nr:alpha/beta fold hydrolase [Coriobacteriaceae bacterium]